MTKKILLVDDVDFDRERMIRALEADPSAQYEFMELSDGETLEKVALEWKPDLIVLDFALPVLNGLELLRRLSTRPSGQDELPFAVLMVTGNGDEETAVEAMKLGAADYAPKESLTPSHIREVIRRALRHTALQQEVARHRRELSESEWRLRQLANAMPQVVWITGALGHIEYVNQQWMDLTGLTLEQTQVQAWKGAVHPDDFAIATETWARALAAGEAFTTEYRYRQASSGTYRWHLIRFNPIRDAVSGQVGRWYGTSTDVHDSKTLQLALNDALQARDDFLSIASHELRTPLTCLKLKSQLLARQIDQGRAETFSGESVKKQNEQTAREVDKLIRLVDDMLDITRIRAGKLDFEMEAMDFCELAREVFDKMAPMMADAGTPLKLVCADRIHGIFDRFRIEQVLINLLTNAMRYGKQKPVELSIRDESRHVVVEVKDQGIGIDSSAYDRIFQRFERVGAPQAVKGLGLGLFIAKQILEAHQGTIRAMSDGVGKGSTFIVTLPLQSTVNRTDSL